MKARVRGEEEKACPPLSVGLLPPSGQSSPSAFGSLIKEPKREDYKTEHVFIQKPLPVWHN